jgi:FemAB-related protein (PEP-CTERM system-associated)
MEIRTILQDVPAAIAQRWGAIDNCPHRDQIALVCSRLDSTKAEIKHKKNEKQLCAKQFGVIKSAGGDIELHKQSMQTISRELDDLEERRKALEAELSALFAAESAPAQLFPARFRATTSTQTAAAASKIVRIEAQQASLWDAYVAGHPQASFYHQYQWRTVVEKSFGHDSFYLAAVNAEGTICGILPIIRLNSRLFGDFGVSLPFFNYGGVLADNGAIARQLLQEAAAIATAVGMQHLEIRSTQAVIDWPARTDKVSMILALPTSVEELDKQIGAKVRAQIKRAQQEAPDVLIGHRELLDDFYRVFAINMRDLGTPVYAKAFFDNILQAWPQQSHIVIVRLAGRPCAAAFLLDDRDMMEIPWASTLKSVNALNMNMLLYTAILKFTIEQGYAFFDFGRSSIDSGTFRFKKQWGAQPLQHHWHYWLANGGELPALKPDSPKFRFVIACWQRLPVFITRLLGPRIVQYLP